MRHPSVHRAVALLCLLAPLAKVAHADVICRKKNGVVVSRSTCKSNETAFSVSLTPSGPLGLGTTSAPAAMLDVNGQAVFRDTVSFVPGQSFPDTAGLGSNTFSGSQTIGGKLDVTGTTNFGNIVTFAAGQTFPDTATLGANTFVGDQMIGGNAILTGQVGIGVVPSHALSLDGSAPQSIALERNLVADSPGSPLTVQAGGATAGATDMAGGALVLAGGIGTGTGGGGNVYEQTAPPTTAGTGDGALVDRHIVVAKPRQITLTAPGFVSLMSINLTGTNTAGGWIRYTVRATDGGSQIATEAGVIRYLATANSITCSVDTTDKLHLGTVNSGCTPGFFNPGSHPGVSIFDNVAFSSPAAIVTHEIYFTIENESGSAIILQ